MNEPKLTLDQVFAMDLPPIIVYAAPIMFALVFVEYFIRIRKLSRSYDTKDAWAATAVGIGNIISSALTKVVTFGVVLS